jgi:hypothetical protein
LNGAHWALQLDWLPAVGDGGRPRPGESIESMIPGLLPALLRKIVSVTAAGIARKQVRRWLLGEISLQHMWDQAWRRSAVRKEKQRDEDGPDSSPETSVDDPRR